MPSSATPELSPDVVGPQPPRPSPSSHTASDVQNDDDDTDTPAENSVGSNATFLHASNRLTRDYVASHLHHATELLHTAASRSAFVTDIFGDASLSSHAHTDPPFLRQLQTRASVLAVYSIPIVSTNSHFSHVDATIALLALVAARWPILISVFEHHQVIIAIVTAMHKWSDTPVIVARCMTALRVFAVTDSVRKQIMVDGGLNLTLHFMQRYPDDKRIQLRAPAVIANVAFGCTHRKRRIARQGALRLVIRGMIAFPDEEDIQLRGALTIRNLTHQAQVNQYIAGNEGAIHVISAALMRFRASSTRPELRFHCVMALESLCREDERNRQRVVDIDTGHVSGDKQVSVDDSVGINKSSDDDHFNGKCVNEDGDIVVDEEEILLAHTTSNFRHGEALIPGRGGKLLDTSPLVSSGSCSGQKSTDEYQRAGINDVALGRHRGENNISDEKRSSLFRTIIHTIRRDPDDELLVETALSLLTLVSMGRREVQRRIGLVGGIQVAIAAMRKHHTNCAVIAKACGLIRGLCFEECNRAYASSGLVVMVEATHEHRRDGDTAREIVSALSNAVFQNEKNRALIVAKGGIEAVLTVMEECGGSDVMVLEACICALRNFVDTSESGAVYALNKGVVKAVVVALKQTRDDTSEGIDLVREQCMFLLTDLAQLVPRAREEMLDVKAARWIRHTTSQLDTQRFADVHKEMFKLLRMLDESDRKRKLSDARAGHRMAAPAATNIIGRPAPRGLFSALSMGRRQKALRSTDRSAVDGKLEFPRISGVSTVDGSQSSGRKGPRLSARFWRSAVVS